MTLQIKDSELLKTQAYIDSQWVDSADGTYFDGNRSINPIFLS